MENYPRAIVTKGHIKKIYKVTLNRFFATCNIDYRQWTTQATNRMSWRQFTRPPLPLKPHDDRRSGPVHGLDRHTRFESCAAVLSHGQVFSLYIAPIDSVYE